MNDITGKQVVILTSGHPDLKRGMTGIVNGRVPSHPDSWSVTVTGMFCTDPIQIRFEHQERTVGLTADEFKVLDL